MPASLRASYLQTHQVAIELLPKKNQHTKPTQYRVTNLVHKEFIPTATILDCRLSTMKERILWAAPKMIINFRGQYSLQNWVRK